MQVFSATNLNMEFNFIGKQVFHDKKIYFTIGWSEKTFLFQIKKPDDLTEAVGYKNNFWTGFTNLPPTPRWLIGVIGHVTTKILENLITGEPLEVESWFWA